MWTKLLDTAKSMSIGKGPSAHFGKTSESVCGGIQVILK
jgi:hypothetical protein